MLGATVEKGAAWLVGVSWHLKPSKPATPEKLPQMEGMAVHAVRLCAMQHTMQEPVLVQSASKPRRSRIARTRS